MGIRKISLIIGIAVAILGLNYLLNLYNEKFVDVNSKDYIIEQFTKENIGNKSIIQSLCLQLGHSLLQVKIHDLLFFILSIITDEKLQNKVQKTKT